MTNRILRVFSILLCLVTILGLVPQPASFGQTADRPAGSSGSAARITAPGQRQENLAFGPPSPLLAEAQRRVAEQLPRSYAASAFPDPLPAGTVALQSESQYYTYLPLVVYTAAPEGETERVDLRGRYSKTFQRPDGSGHAVVYLAPIHYRTAEGTWAEIDNTLVVDPESGGLRNAANDFVVQVAGDTGGIQLPGGEQPGLLRLIDGKTTLTIRPLDTDLVAGATAGPVITYANVLPGTDLIGGVGGGGFELRYVLREAPAGPFAPQWQVQVEGGTLEVVSGTLVLRRPAAAPWFFALNAVAADGLSAGSATWELSELGGENYQLGLVVDNNWLQSAETLFPVSIDATGTRGDVRDAYVESNYPDIPCGNQFNLYLGRDTWYSKGHTRIFTIFDSPNLPPGSVINSARAYFYQYAVESGTSYQTYACRVAQDWGEYAITWRNQPPVAACNGCVTTGNNVDWQSWDITTFAQAWQGGTANYGIELIACDEWAAGGVYYSRDCVSQCPGGQHPYMWLDYTLNPVLRIYTGLSFAPGSTVGAGTRVTADFWAKNIGGGTFTGRLQANTNGTPTFAAVAVSIAPNNGTYHYARSQVFNTIGTYNVCAQYYDGSWHNLTPEGSGVTCRTLNVVAPASVRLSTPLSLTPNELEPSGGAVRAQYTVQNYDPLTSTERYRARVTSGSVTFNETGDIILGPGHSYAYDNTKTFTQPGIYEVIAEHRVAGVWTPLIGQGSGFIRVKEPPPPPPEQEKGFYPPNTDYIGEPVASNTGNYVSNVTDMVDSAPGLSLGVTRWYNSIDAAAVDGPFGYGTSWTYNMAVTWRVDKSAVVQMADGHLGYFWGSIDPADPDNMAGTYMGQGRETGNTLTRASDGTAVLTMTDQTAYHFNTAGQLTRISSPHPAEIVVVYAGGRPMQLVHSAGVTYTITYNGSYIGAITSSNGQAASYTYSAAGDLATVTRPDGSTYHYLYDANHRLTEGYDTENQLFVGNVYDAQGRVAQQYDLDGRVSAIAYGLQITDPRVYTDVLGSVITHTYDANYRIIQEEDALGYVTVYTRDARGKVVARQDRTGATWRYAYDSRGNLISETNPLGETWTYAYDAHNNRISQISPLGDTWTSQYDGNNRLVRSTNPLGYDREYGYDARGNLVWEADENGAITRYGYDALGRQTAITDALGSVTRIAYDEFANQTVYTDANGSVARFAYDDLHRLVQSTDPMGTVITFTYDLMGNLLAESDGMGHLKYYSYDDYNRLVAESDWHGNLTRYGYDALGQKTVVTDALGYTTVYTYNAAGNLVASRNKMGAVNHYEYDPEGRLLRETDPLGRVKEYVYDAAGRRIEVRTPCDVCPGGMAVSYTAYDATGRVLQETDARGAITRYTYDPLGRLAVVMDTYGYTRTYSCDPAGRTIQKIDPVGAVTRYTYDLLGRLITTTDALGYQTANRYDAVGNLVQTLKPCCGYVITYTYDANDRLVALVDPLGNTSRRTYDAAGHLLAATDPLSRTTYYAYDAGGNQVAITDARGFPSYTTYDALNRPVRKVDVLGHTTLTGYDPLGRVISQTDALGYVRTFTYDVVGRKTAEHSPLGYTTIYTYSVADNLVARRDPDGAVWRFSYDASGNQTGQTNPLGYTWATEYDLLGRAVRETDPLGAVTTSEYDPAGQLITRTDPRGAVSRTEYDLLGHVVRETGPLGHARAYTYDAAGNRVGEQDELGAVTTSVCDVLNRLIAKTDPLGHTSYTLYDAAGQVTATIDYNGYATLYTYDAGGNRVRTTDPLGNAATTVYDALNRAVAASDPLGRTTTTGYDALGRVITTTNPAGHTMTYTYDAEGRRTARTDALGHTWLTQYDPMGRPVHETDPLGRVRQTAYDAAGRVSSRTDPLGRVTACTYDPLGRLLVLTGPDGTTQRYTYDPVGNALTEQDGSGQITRYEYDLNSRPLRKTDPLGQVWHYQYDAAGRLVGTATPGGHLIVQSYDALGRLVGKSYDGTPQVTLAYDPNGNRRAMTDTLGVTTYVYDPLNHLVASTDPAGRTVQYQYDAAGRRITLTYPDGSAAHYTYDAAGSLHQVTAPDGGVTHYERDALGRPVLVTQANGVTVATAYDAAGNVQEITQRTAADVIFAHLVYTVDAADRRTRIVQTLPQGTVTTDYTYDVLDRLVDSAGSDGAATHYTFDAAGNRTAELGVRQRGGNLESYQVAYTYNAANQLLRAVDSVLGETVYTYDADGGRAGQQSPALRAAYAYDAEGRLLEARVETWAGGIWAYRDGVYERYTYDGGGHRVRKDRLLAADNTLVLRREYRYDHASEWDVLQTYDSGGSSTERRFLYDQGLHKLAYWEGGAAGYFQNEALGSVLGTTDAAGSPANPGGLMRYGDYGQELGPLEALPTDDAYTGYERDAYSGLDYARNRYYEPATGIFLSLDPYPADREDLLDLHRYLYVQGNPLNATDPLGLFNWSTQTVEPGDTLWSIATDWGTAVDELLRHNPQITDRNLIYPGQHINLPPCRSAKCQVMARQENVQSFGTTASNCGGNCGFVYTVVPGDTLSAIGARFGVSWVAIYNANRYVIGDNPSLIYPGQQLQIPCVGAGGGGGGTPGYGNSPYQAYARELDLVRSGIRTLSEQIDTLWDQRDHIEFLMVVYNCMIHFDSPRCIELQNAYEAVSLALHGLCAARGHLTNRVGLLESWMEMVPESWPMRGDPFIVSCVGEGYPNCGEYGDTTYPARRGSAHTGLDMYERNGSIIATHRGTVTYAGWYGDYGFMIDITSGPVGDEGSTYMTRYAHLSSILVAWGQEVGRGTRLAEMGTTGNSTGLHLHYEVWKNGVRNNPHSYGIP